MDLMMIFRDDGDDADDDDGDDISGAEQTDNVTLSKFTDTNMNSVKERVRQALQKFRILLRAPSREHRSPPKDSNV